jgi:hypothetical protein
MFFSLSIPQGVTLDSDLGKLEAMFNLLPLVLIIGNTLCVINLCVFCVWSGVLVAVFRPSSPPMHALVFFRLVKCHLLHALVNE